MSRSAPVAMRDPPPRAAPPRSFLGCRAAPRDLRPAGSLAGGCAGPRRGSCALATPGRSGTPRLPPNTGGRSRPLHEDVDGPLDATPGLHPGRVRFAARLGDRVVLARGAARRRRQPRAQMPGLFEPAQSPIDGRIAYTVQAGVLEPGDDVVPVRLTSA